MRLKFLPAVAAAALLTLAACGSSKAASRAASSGAATTAMAAMNESNDADVVFAQSMIAHHQQAVEMSSMALDAKAGAAAAVKDLATRIKAAQDPENTQMTAWLTKHNRPTTMASSGGHDMPGMNSASGMMSTADMDALGKKTGKDFDASWLKMMIDHHTGAITMAQTVKTSGKDTEMRALADKIITAQQKEITEMKTLAAA